MDNATVSRLIRTFVRQNMDLLMVLAAALLTIPLALLTEGPLRVAFAIPFIIFIPGYCLVAALYPRRGSLDIIERLALSFGTSIAVVPLTGLVLNYTPWGIRLIPILLSVSGFIVIMCGIAAYRRHNLYPMERYTVDFALPKVNWQGMGRTDRLLTMTLVASIVFAVGTLIYVVATPKAGEQFTEFYILGPGGMADGYPTSMRMGEPTDLIMGVVNHEGEPVVYTIEARLDADSAGVRLTADDATVMQVSDYSFAIGPLEHEEKWEHAIAVEALQTGDQLKLEFLLFSPRLRDGYHLRALLVGDGYVSIELKESQGRATVTLQAGDATDHNCRVEAWQGGQLVSQEEVLLGAGTQQKLDLRYPPGETEFRLYDGGEIMLDDAGNELALHLWVDVD